MNRESSRPAMARNLLVLVAGSGLIIALVGLSAIALLRRSAERSARAAMEVIAQQAAARIGAYLSHQREMLRAMAGLVAGNPDSERRLAQIALDAPSLGRVILLTARTPADQLPQHLAQADVAAALGGREVASPLYFRDDLTPAMDVCVPAGAAPGSAVCATLDLLELQRQVQRIRIGASGFALAFDADGRLLAAGAPRLRAKVLTGEPIAESPLASQMAHEGAAPAEFRGGLGEDVLAVGGRPEPVGARRREAARELLSRRGVRRDLARKDRQDEEEQEQKRPDHGLAVAGDRAPEVGTGPPSRRLERRDGRVGYRGKAHERSRVRGSRIAVAPSATRIASSTATVIIKNSACISA